MSTITNFRGKPIIRVSDGKQLGAVTDVYLDYELTRITAIHLGSEGIIRRSAQTIDRASVTVMGVDAWLVAAPTNVVGLGDIAGSDTYVRAGTLRGRQIVTDGGTPLGTIGDVIVDESGAVLGFALAKVAVQGPLAERKTIARAAISALGDERNPMTAVLARAEEIVVGQA
jgi:uncharacterized protein YrrD